MPATLLFVYGSLLSEVPSAMSLFLRTHSQGFEPLYLPGKLYDLGYYPGFVHLPQASTLVYGEVHQLLDADKALRELDAYECVDEVPPEYLRLLLPIPGCSDQVWAYIYQFSVAQLPEIVGGDYRQHYAQNEQHLNFIKQGRNV